MPIIPRRSTSVAPSMAPSAALGVRTPNATQATAPRSAAIVRSSRKRPRPPAETRTYVSAKMPIATPRATTSGQGRGVGAKSAR